MNATREYYFLPPPVPKPTELPPTGFSATGCPRVRFLPKNPPVILPRTLRREFVLTPPRPSWLQRGSSLPFIVFVIVCVVSFVIAAMICIGTFGPR